jgi:hypothetical protein
VTAVDPWALGLLVAAFAGGAFGAAVGALPSFSLAGLVVVVGETYRLVVRTGSGELAVDLTGQVAFGPVLGPHVAFGGGAAALAYASRRGYLEERGFDYHPAKEVTRGLGSRPDVLAVGGLFGVLGHLVAAGAGSVGLPTDPVALGVVGSALAHRLAFGYSLVGASPRRWFDMRPYERAAGETAPDGGAPSGEMRDSSSQHRRSDGDERTVEPWLPYQYRWSHVVALGAVLGVLGAYVAYLTASPFLAFGLSVVVLFLANADVAAVPVTHHLTLPASTAVLALVDAPFAELTPGLVADAVALPTALLVGAGFGVLGAVVGEAAQRIFYAHAETHLDPPAASIVVTSLFVGLLAVAGVLASPVWAPLP